MKNTFKITTTELQRNNVLFNKKDKTILGSLDIKDKKTYNKVMTNFENKVSDIIETMSTNTKNIESILELSHYVNDLFNMLTSSIYSKNEIGSVIKDTICPILLKHELIIKQQHATKVCFSLRNIANNSGQFIEMINSRLKEGKNVNLSIRTCDNELRKYLKSENSDEDNNKRAPQQPKEKSRDEKIEAQAKSLNKLIEKDGIEIFAYAMAIKFNTMTNVEKCNFYRIFNKNIDGNFDDYKVNTTPIKIPKITSQPNRIPLKTV